jgi:hypothetical protein
MFKVSLSAVVPLPTVVPLPIISYFELKREGKIHII